MAKRFTDTTIWEKKWFRLLTPKMKEAWRYLYERCDHAGIWDIDMDSMSYLVNERITEQELMDSFGDRIMLVSKDKLWLTGFIEFQYKCEVENLNPANKVHASVITIINKYDRIKPLASPMQGAMQGAKDKEKEKDKDKDKEKEKDKDPEESVTTVIELRPPDSWETKATKVLNALGQVSAVSSRAREELRAILGDELTGILAKVPGGTGRIRTLPAGPFLVKTVVEILKQASLRV